MLREYGIMNRNQVLWTVYQNLREQIVTIWDYFKYFCEEIDPFGTSIELQNLKSKIKDIKNDIYSFQYSQYHRYFTRRLLILGMHFEVIRLREKLHDFKVTMDGKIYKISLNLIPFPKENSNF